MTWKLVSSRSRKVNNKGKVICKSQYYHLTISCILRLVHLKSAFSYDRTTIRRLYSKVLSEKLNRKPSTFKSACKVMEKLLLKGNQLFLGKKATNSFSFFFNPRIEELPSQYKIFDAP